MDASERAESIRQNRNLLLSALQQCSPGGMTGESLYLNNLTEYPDYGRILCVRDLFYLEKKGYILRRHPWTKREDGNVEWDRARWYLTAAGDEVANKLVCDPALEP